MASKVKAAGGVEKAKSATAANKGRPETKAAPSARKSSAKSSAPKTAVPAAEPARQRDDLPAIALAIPPAELDAQNQAYFDKCVEKIGFVPNVLQAYALDMAKLNAFAGMYNDLMLAPSGLSKLEREMIAVVVSSINRCYYCLTAHGAAVRQLSGDPILGEQMVMNYRAARLDPRRRAMLDFAAKLTERPHEVEEDDRAALRKVGFSERDIWDIGAVVGFFNMSNRIASATDMRPNEEYHVQARTPKG
ncbi:putative peroxidase-related enzyme [Xanthobacter sp. SG618]|nr:putative peroxidase-related enzyme [Xanthobacter sp. SG618]